MLIFEWRASGGKERMGLGCFSFDLGLSFISERAIDVY